MLTSIKLLATIFVTGTAALGLLLAFGIATPEYFSENALKFAIGIAVLVVTIVALKAISGGRSASDTEPPPQL